MASARAAKARFYCSLPANYDYTCICCTSASILPVVSGQERFARCSPATVRPSRWHAQYLKATIATDSCLGSYLPPTYLPTCLG
ncbi:hypothetical protein LY76DRAFT_595455 [Colletotrichum caudatum]|nr:hypothetical protein LY76DRAFT_595455 [Colletotrichum caudatum]